MPDYSKGAIYKITCLDKDITDIYIGSTTNITQRKAKHKSVCKNSNDKEHNSGKYKFFRDHGGWDNWELVWLMDYPCNSKKELEKKEEEVRCELKASLNRCRAHRSIENRKEFIKEYYEANKDKITEYQKEWNEANKDKITEQKKEYYEANKEKINKHRTEKIMCECGSFVRRGNKSKHIKSLKHINFIGQ